MKTIFKLAFCIVMFSTQAYAGTDDIRVGVVTQSAEGVTSEEWTTELLRHQSKILSESSANDAKQAYLDKGGRASEWRPKVNYDASFIYKFGRKFGIVTTHLRVTIKAKPNNIVVDTSAIRIMEIRGSDLVSVICGRGEGKRVSISSEPCDEAIRKTFGVSLAMK